MPFGVPDTRQFPWDEPLSHHLQQLHNEVTGGINTWAVNPTVGVDGSALGTNHVGYTGINTTTSSIVRWNGTAWDGLMDGYKLITTPMLDIYVNQATGNDSNDGKTASTAWKTISKFYQEVNKYNLLSKQVNLYLGAGTYAILFPPTTWGGTIKVVGASSASVTIQRMYINNGTFVMLQGVTIAHPGVIDTNPFYWPLDVSNNSTLQLGSDIVLGPVGNYIPGYARFHGHMQDSTLYFIAGSPITLTGSVNNLFLLYGSGIQIATYYLPTGAPGNLNPAPEVDTGATYSYLPATNSSNTTAVINATGSVTVGNIFNLTDGSAISGPPSWQLSITGSISGAAYALSGTSSINGHVSKVYQPTPGIQFPSSISSGTKDATSTTMGVAF